MTQSLVELSHTIRHGMPTYPGLPSPRIGLHTDHDSSGALYDHRAQFAIGHIDLVGNVGTYIDSPFHRYPDSADVSQIPITRLVDLPTVVVDACDDGRRERRLQLVLHGSLAGRAVLIWTGWDQKWATDGYWQPGPSSVMRPSSNWCTTDRHWSATTSGTSTIPAIPAVLPTPPCWGKASRSSSTCETSGS